MNLTGLESSLVRHGKICLHGTRTGFRKKSCSECVAAKTRCDLTRPTCRRCVAKKVQCQYSRNEDSGSIDDSDTQVLHLSVHHEYIESSRGLPPVEQQLSGESTAEDYSFTTVRNRSSYLSANLHVDSGNVESLDTPVEVLDTLGTPDAVCLSSSTLMSTNENQLVDWNSLMLPSTATIPLLTRHSMEVLLRIFRTWPRMMAKGIRVPPLIHSTQVPGIAESTSLANCFTLVKMWDGQCLGTIDIVKETLKKEMQSLLETVCHAYCLLLY
jgi:hypothetical protein